MVGDMRNKLHVSLFAMVLKSFSKSFAKQSIRLFSKRIFPQQQNALGSSAIVKVSEQTGAAPKLIPPRFPGSKYRFPVQVPK